MLPIKTCGGGKSLGSAKPRAQHASHSPANKPIDTAPQRIRGATTATTARMRSSGRCGSVASGSRLVLELAIEILILGNDLLQQRPIDRIASWLLLDVAHLGNRLDAVEVLCALQRI